MYIEPDEMSDALQLKFKYKVDTFGSEKLQIELEFEYPQFVSTSPEPEFLIIEMQDFRDPEGKLIVKNHTIRKPLPTQLDPETAMRL